MRNLPLVAHHFRVNQCAVQWRWMKGGGEWGEVGAAGLHWAVCRSQLPGLSRQGIRWMLRPNALPASVAAALSPAVLRMDGAICDEHGGVCVGGGGTGGRARLPPVPAHLSHHAPPPWRRLTGPVRSRSTDGRATQYAAALADRRRTTAHEDDAAAVLGAVPQVK